MGYTVGPAFYSDYGDVNDAKTKAQNATITTHPFRVSPYCHRLLIGTTLFRHPSR